MNSPLPFSIASPPFLRRYVEPSSRSIPRYILFSPIITSFYFFFFPPPPITIHRFSRFSVSVSPTRSSINSASLSPLLSSLPPFHFSLFFSLLLLFFSSSFFLTITHCLFFPLRLRATLSLALFLSLHRSPSPSCCVFSSFFLL